MKPKTDDYLSVDDDSALRALIECLGELPWLTTTAPGSLRDLHPDVAVLVASAMMTYARARHIREGGPND